MKLNFLKFDTNLTSYVVRKPKNLLESTNLPISETAVSVGFNSISHFSEVYKSIINESPVKTRKNFYEKQKEFLLTTRT
ncbi:MAG: AraC family transcriptional regulator [Clostridia bacterium]|nr:AraC family transcriptional regulator [Clostridia bacterium]